MKTILRPTLCLLFALACLGTAKAEQPLLKDTADSLNYAIGLSAGSAFRQQLPPSMPLRLEALKAGLGDALDQEATWSTRDAEQYIQATLTMMQFGAIKAEGETFLAENAKRKGVVTTPSGLQYEVLAKGKGDHPKATDKVKVHYEGTLIDGTVFDSSYKRGEPISFALNQVIAGWTEGVQLMSVGAKYKLYIPYQLGYGERGAGGQIPPYSALIFTIELLGINE